MAESSSSSSSSSSSYKRPRDESHMEKIEEETLKRHKSLNDIVSLLEDEEEPEEGVIAESTHDFSCLLSTLQQELSSPNDQENEQEIESVMRHLLEASDDELGIPNTEIRVDFREEQVEVFSLCDGLWEFEDEAANYYTLLHSQLFM